MVQQQTGRTASAVPVPRGPSGRTYEIASLPEGTVRELIFVRASDGPSSFGVLHLPPVATSACAFIMHPRTNQTNHYLAPALLHAGIAVWGQTSRNINNDIDTTHEEVLLDVAAGMRMLRERDFRQVVAIGTSGGGSLLGFYQAQAVQPAEARFESSPSGDPTRFREEVMPPADLYIAVNAHQGEGRVLLGRLDPAVVDENDPLATDADLDMFNPRNGYRTPPEPSHYALEWVERFRQAQLERCRRLDGIARSRVGAAGTARALAGTQEAASLLARQAALTQFMVIYRTGANPAALDPELARPRRPGRPDANPLLGNYGPNGLARVLTPRAWLSTWSALSSQAELTETLHHVTIPSLFVAGDADMTINPSDMRELYELSPATDKTFVSLEYAEHYLTPAPGMPPEMAHPLERGSAAITSWIRERLA